MNAICYDFVAVCRFNGDQWTTRGDVWAETSDKARQQIRDNEPHVVDITLVPKKERQIDPRWNTIQGRHSGKTWGTTR